MHNHLSKKQDSANESGARSVVPVGGKNPAAVALGRLGGLKGGKARAAKLTKKQRSEIARHAAKVHWSKESSSGQRS